MALCDNKQERTNSYCWIFSLAKIMTHLALLATTHKNQNLCSHPTIFTNPNVIYCPIFVVFLNKALLTYLQ